MEQSTKTNRFQTMLEWLAALLVVLGVAFMIGWQGSNVVLYVVGIAMLTIGVRLAIDCSKRSRD